MLNAAENRPDLTVPPGQKALLRTILATILAGTIFVKIVMLRGFADEIFWGSYALVITGYLLSRFLLALLYKPARREFTDDELPVISVIVPAKNEEHAIEETLRRILASDYPAGKLEVIAVNDGSTDGTLERMKAVWREHPDMLRIVSMENRGKRFAMAEGFVRSRGSISVMVDSDSFVEPESLRKIVAYFTDDSVGAVCGHADVWNAKDSLLTRMQSVRYFAAFKVIKAAEARYGNVSCCSGCFSAYRRTAIEPILTEWLDQTFVDTVSTYGDDRSLTNFVLRQGLKVFYAPDAQAWTIVPNTFRMFMRQQLRWKKSWIRESVRAGGFMWSKQLVPAVGFYTAILLTLMAPVVFLRWIVIRPLTGGGHPWFYVGGICVMSLFYGLYHRLYRRSGDWLWGVVYALFYSTVMIWQTPYALATLRDVKWGTR